MVKLTTLSVSEIADQLDEPFAIADVAHVGDIIVSVYICLGKLEWHSHLDVDEMFWVYEGAMWLDSERGNVRLRSDELSVVPKGVGHRSRSGVRTVVLLLRCGFLPDRKNGRRRLYAIDDEADLPRVNLRDAAQSLPEPRRFQTVARIEETTLQVGRGGGNWTPEVPAANDRLIYVLDGVATVRTSQSMQHLHPGDLAVVPRGAIYQLSSGEAMLVRAGRELGR